ncbi:hypothetical protein HDU91_003130, partial [Kappamyces sp. JEL0680]
VQARLAGAVFAADSVGEWPAERQAKVLLLGTASTRLTVDPSASQELVPDDANHYDYLLFGGILGDDPPRDRTGILRRMGFATRHLGPVQMTTDTAVLVAQQIIQYQRPMSTIAFVDHPEIAFSKKESVQLPFRFLANPDGSPQLAPGLFDHLKAQNDEPLDF